MEGWTRGNGNRVVADSKCFSFYSVSLCLCVEPVFFHCRQSFSNPVRIDLTVVDWGDMKTKSKSWLAIAGFGAAVAGAAWFGSRYSPKNARTRLWYSRLEKPSYNPPDYVFPIAWSTLYTLMAISGWRVWNEADSPERSKALRLWVSQLLANAQWSKLFFGDHRPVRALVDVVALEAMIVRYIATARKVDNAAALCFVPYAAWVGFATVLNAEIALRNPDAHKKFPRAKAA